MWRNLILLCAMAALGAGLTYMLDHTALPGSPRDAGTAESSGPLPQMRRPAPDFSFTALDGRQGALKNFKGKIVLLNFWASWCAPCVREFPDFLRLAAEFPDRLVFIALSGDHDEKAMNAFLSKMAYKMPEEMGGANVYIGLDAQSRIARDMFQTYRLPETFLIDPGGAMREKLIGADWNYQDLKEKIKSLN